MDHPQSPWAPCPWFTQDYGFISPMPFNWIEKPWQLAAGQSVGSGTASYCSRARRRKRGSNGCAGNGRAPSRRVVYHAMDDLRFDARVDRTAIFDQTR